MQRSPHPNICRRARAALVRQIRGAVGSRPQQICTVLAATVVTVTLSLRNIIPRERSRPALSHCAIILINTGHQYCKHSVILPSPKPCEKLRKRHHRQARRPAVPALLMTDLTFLYVCIKRLLIKKIPAHYIESLLLLLTDKPAWFRACRRVHHPIDSSHFEPNICYVIRGCDRLSQVMPAVYACL